MLILACTNIIGLDGVVLWQEALIVLVELTMRVGLVCMCLGGHPFLVKGVVLDTKKSQLFFFCVLCVCVREKKLNEWIPLTTNIFGFLWECSSSLLDQNRG